MKEELCSRVSAHVDASVLLSGGSQRPRPQCQHNPFSRTSLSSELKLNQLNQPGVNNHFTTTCDNREQPLPLWPLHLGLSRPPSLCGCGRFVLSMKLHVILLLCVSEWVRQWNWSQSLQTEAQVFKQLRKLVLSRHLVVLRMACTVGQSLVNTRASTGFRGYNTDITPSHLISGGQ